MKNHLRKGFLVQNNFECRNLRIESNVMSQSHRKCRQLTELKPYILLNIFYAKISEILGDVKNWNLTNSLQLKFYRFQAIVRAVISIGASGAERGL